MATTTTTMESHYPTSNGNGMPRSPTAQPFPTSPSSPFFYANPAGTSSTPSLRAFSIRSTASSITKLKGLFASRGKRREEPGPTLKDLIAQDQEEEDIAAFIPSPSPTTMRFPPSLPSTRPTTAPGPPATMSPKSQPQSPTTAEQLPAPQQRQNTNSKSRTIIRMLTTKFTPKSTGATDEKQHNNNKIQFRPPPAVANSPYSKDARDAALRARGLLPPLRPNKDMSTQEMEQDMRIPVVVEVGSDEGGGGSSEGSGSLENGNGLSAADLIKLEWEKRNKERVVEKEQRERMTAFKFGGSTSAPPPVPVEAHMVPLPPSPAPSAITPPSSPPALDLDAFKTPITTYSAPAVVSPDSSVPDPLSPTATSGSAFSITSIAYLTPSESAFECTSDFPASRPLPVPVILEETISSPVEEPTSQEDESPFTPSSESLAIPIPSSASTGTSTPTPTPSTPTASAQLSKQATRAQFLQLQIQLGLIKSVEQTQEQEAPLPVIITDDVDTDTDTDADAESAGHAEEEEEKMRASLDSGISRASVQRPSMELGVLVESEEGEEDTGKDAEGEGEGEGEGDKQITSRSDDAAAPSSTSMSTSSPPHSPVLVPVRRPPQRGLTDPVASSSSSAAVPLSPSHHQHQHHQQKPTSPPPPTSSTKKSLNPFSFKRGHTIAGQHAHGLVVPNDENQPQQAQRRPSIMAKVGRSVVGTITGGGSSSSKARTRKTIRINVPPASYTNSNGPIPLSPSLIVPLPSSPLPSSPPATYHDAQFQPQRRPSQNLARQPSQAGVRQAVAPVMYNRGSILLETAGIEDEESRRMTELAFLG